MLLVEGLEFSYQNGKVLEGVGFSLESGIGCLLGPNGAGKSTLIKCIAGVLQPTAGRIELNGASLLSMGFRERSKLVSYAPQEFGISFPYTVFEVVLMGRNPHVNPLEGPGEDDEEKAWKALEALGITDLAEKPFTNLSGGQKRLILIARALAQEGELLLFDEPTSFLDFRNQHLVLSVIGGLAKDLGKLVLVSLHDPNQALLFCDTVFLMREGKVVASGRAEDVVTGENLEALYGVGVRLIEVDGLRFVVPEKDETGLNLNSSCGGRYR